MKTFKTVFCRILGISITILVINFIGGIISGIFYYDDKLNTKIDRYVSDELDSLYVSLQNDKNTKCVGKKLNFIPYDIYNNQSWRISRIGKYDNFDYYEIRIDLDCDKGIHFNGYTREEIYESMYKTHYFYTKRINKSDVKLTLFEFIFLNTMFI